MATQRHGAYGSLPLVLGRFSTTKNTKERLSQILGTFIFVTSVFFVASSVVGAIGCNRSAHRGAVFDTSDFEKWGQACRLNAHTKRARLYGPGF